MRPKRLSYTVAAASATGYKSNATAAAWTLTSTTGPSDGLAHLVTIYQDAANAADHSGKTAIIVGTDAEGREQTETIAALPAASGATVTSTKYFKTVTSVTPSASISNSTMDIGWSAVGVTPAIPISPYSTYEAQVQADVGGTINYDVQATNDNPWEQTTPYWKSVIDNETVDAATMLSAGTTAFRALVNSHTSGTISLMVSQPT